MFYRQQRRLASSLLFEFLKEYHLELLSVVNTLAAAATIIAAIFVAANYSPRTMVAGFSIFVVASLLWIWSGVLDGKQSLIIQNVVLLAVNIFGLWRWLPRASQPQNQNTSAA